ncbi:MAG TPA: hypothetical protein DEQ09_12895 [Bacteroidales bacterium]|nr:hypothetical protein [Bacteroidales bacterium]
MHKTILFFIILLASFTVDAQYEELREIFVEAESHYLFDEYELANPLYLILEEYMADNANIKFKIGNCYLHIPNEKNKAIPYLKQAVENASYDANPDSFREKRAPLEAYFALASAYRINYEFDKALNIYAKLKSLSSGKEVLKNADYIDQQINACRTVMAFVDNPVEFNKQNLGPDINVGSMDLNPAVSGDGNSLVYTENRGLENRIYHSRKEGGKWEKPVDITDHLGGETDMTSSCLNMDGTELYLYKTDDYDGNIYMSSYSNGTWSVIEKLNRNINTKFYESHACISSDGSRLYFTSNREGGEGGLDIYVSEKNTKGEWGTAIHLGPEINTTYNENTPFITRDDSKLFFSSEGHTNMGGYDIFYSKRRGIKWGSPFNLGFPLNTPDDDLFFQPYNNGKAAYYSMLEGYKDKDIFYLVMNEKQSVSTYEIKGIVSLSDTIREFNDSYKIILYSKSLQDTLDVGYPNKSTGFYSFIVKPDEYSLTYEGVSYISVTEEITIHQDHLTKEEIINVTLEPDPNFVAEKLDYSKVKVIDAIDSSLLVTDVIVKDVSDSDSTDEDVLYYTVQVLALHNPVDVTFFKHAEVSVVYNKEDKFYRYTTGKYLKKNDAYRRKDELIRLGYPDDLFIKTVFREKK